MTVRRRFLQRRPLFVSVAVVSASASIVFLSGAGQTPAPDQSSMVQQVALQALITEQTSFMPASLSNLQIPEAKLLRSGESKTLATVPAAIANGPTSQEIALASVLGRDRINALFTKSAAAKQLQQQGTVIDSLAAHTDPNTRPLGGGVSSVTWDQITLTPETAILRGRTVFWAELAQKESRTGKWSVARPSNECTVDMTLLQVSPGVWKVSEYTWHFSPGSEP